MHSRMKQSDKWLMGAALFAAAIGASPSVLAQWGSARLRAIRRCPPPHRATFRRPTRGSAFPIRV